jgi:hypothetical protein
MATLHVRATVTVIMEEQSLELTDTGQHVGETFTLGGVTFRLIQFSERDRLYFNISKEDKAARLSLTLTDAKGVQWSWQIAGEASTGGTARIGRGAFTGRWQQWGRARAR